MTSFAWGAYLACSWTWSIGLFIPVIMFADVGAGAWPILFACNVGGAALFAFVIHGPASNAAFVARNRAACRVFSAVTILAQAWFAGWVATRLPVPLAAAAVGVAALFLVCGRADTRWLLAALLAWALTAAAFGLYLLTSAQADLPAALAQEFAWHPGALYALPLTLTGFALSPYLDLTFHHAAQSSPAPRRSFGLVFPILFGAMLLFSLAYRDQLAPLMLSAQAGPVPGAMRWVLVAMIVQVGFTLILHVRLLPPEGGLARGLPTAAAALALLAYAIGDRVVWGGQTLNDVAYRAMLGFYAVLVPCWVWAAAFSTKRPHGFAVMLTIAAMLTAALPIFVSTSLQPLYIVAFVLILATRLPARA